MIIIQIIRLIAPVISLCVLSMHNIDLLLLSLSFSFNN